jgi:hypothetical protein
MPVSLPPRKKASRGGADAARWGRPGGAPVGAPDTPACQANATVSGIRSTRPNLVRPRRLGRVPPFTRKRHCRPGVGEVLGARVWADCVILDHPVSKRTLPFVVSVKRRTTPLGPEEGPRGKADGHDHQQRSAESASPPAPGMSTGNMPGSGSRSSTWASPPCAASSASSRATSTCARRTSSPPRAILS